MTSKHFLYNQLAFSETLGAKDLVAFPPTRRGHLRLMSSASPGVGRDPHRAKLASSPKNSEARNCSPGTKSREIHSPSSAGRRLRPDDPTQSELFETRPPGSAATHTHKSDCRTHETEAGRLLAESIAIWREIGDQGNLAHSLNGLGRVLLETGNQMEAHKIYLEALAAARNASLIPVMLDALLGNAVLRAHQRETESALRLLTHIKDHPAGIQATRNRAAKLNSDLRSTAAAETAEMTNAVHHEHEFDQLVEEILNN